MPVRQTMRPSFLITGILAALPAGSLKIATSLQWIEHTPQAYAIENFYNGSSAASLTSGGVFNLAADSSVDLAANAETQGLRVLPDNKNIRLIYVICEAGYRLVASRASGIETLADLRGKRIGTMRGTSAQYFVAKLLETAGVSASDYTIVAGGVCMRAPCGEGTFPQMLADGQIDAFGIWEPAVELGIQALGLDDAVVFQNTSIYREVYSLYTTTEKLADEETRGDIVEFVRALNQTLDVFTNQPESVYSFVADEIGMDAAVVEDVWTEHKWTGTWDESLLDFIVQEDQWLANEDGRAAVSEAELDEFLDESIIAEL